MKNSGDDNSLSESSNNKSIDVHTMVVGDFPARVSPNSGSVELHFKEESFHCQEESFHSALEFSPSMESKASSKSTKSCSTPSSPSFLDRISDNSSNEDDVSDIVPTCIERELTKSASASTATPHIRNSKTTFADGDDGSTLDGIENPWTVVSDDIRMLLVRGMVAIAEMAARNPLLTIFGVVSLSLLLVGAGSTRYELIVDMTQIFTPSDSRTQQHQDWVAGRGAYATEADRRLQELRSLEVSDSDFERSGSDVIMIVHADGENVISVEGVRRLFHVVDQVRTVGDYDTICARSAYVDYYGMNTCQIFSVTKFWNHNSTLFEEEVQTQEQLLSHLANKTYPDGTRNDLGATLGVIERENRKIVGAQAFFVLLKSAGNAKFNEKLEKKVLKVRKAWQKEENNIWEVEVNVPTSFENETRRAIMRDLPLIPLVMIMIIAFTSLVFFRCDRVESRTLLAVGATTSIVLSMASGYGSMWLCGVPFTPMTTVIPFITFGIGLDDAFIIHGAFIRTDKKKDIVERIIYTMEDIGLSIVLTTITTTLAFALGTLTSIPAIRYLCYYAFPTILFVLLYQITFFIAWLVLDERRVKAHKSDCCFCITVSSGADTDLEEVSSEEQQEQPSMVENTMESSARRETEQTDEHFSLQFMRAYADVVLLPHVKVVVILLFLAFFGFCVHATTNLKQEMNVDEFLPSDSYATDYIMTLERYTARVLGPFIYFRNVDQSDPEIQAQMIDYVSAVVDVPGFGEEPPLCWVTDIKKAFDEVDPVLRETILGMTFRQQMGLAFADPDVRSAYGSDIVLDEDGNILSSRCRIFITDLDLDDISAQIDLLQNVRAVTEAQPINQGKKDWAFFTHDLQYNLFEFYEVLAEELALTSITSFAAVTFVAFLFVPHWTAVPIIIPMLAILYIDLLGVIQFSGMNINAVTYVSLAVSIGLLVDFVMHILLRYYESPYETRHEKVKDALTTMGSSILMGGLSTFIGVVPLLFSATAVFAYVSLTFLGMVLLGISHGLIFMPVLLSIMGPLPKHAGGENSQKPKVMVDCATQVGGLDL